jgi:hypothetical protein
MTLKVIGSGLGRTGTLSLKNALEQLGFGPCHHMVEVFMHPESVPLWVAAGAGDAKWDKIFESYGSAVDYPGAASWREICAHYPDAKVIHTVRDADKWFDSTQATIFAEGGGLDNPPPPMQAFFETVSRGFREQMHDRAFMTDYFRRHTAQVQAAIPRDRLLVYEAGDGWAPLCAFLGVPVPAAPYPRENSTEEFQARQRDHAGGPPNADAIRAELAAARDRIAGPAA